MDNVFKKRAVKIVTTEKEDGFMKSLRLGSLFNGSHCRKVLSGCLVLGLVLALGVPSVPAFNIDTGNPDWRIDWDNTLTYSTVYRLNDQDDEYLTDPNMDDGNRNFDKGFVMNRLDLFSELDISYKRFGVRFSGAGWYDHFYNQSNDNDSPGTVNQVSKNHDEFSDDTRDLHGRYAELLDAFTFGTTYLGNTRLSYKLGQFAQLWGESFFFGGNGVAAGMSPFDLPKVGTMPNAQSKEMIIPVPQASATLQFTPSLELGGYYQFKWKPGRWFGSGSYFAFVDLIGTAEPEFLIAGPNNDPMFRFDRIDNIDARDDGQYGLKLKYTTPNGIDLGLYYMNYHWKEIGGDNLVVNPVAGQYSMFFPEDIKLYGVSANASVGIWTIGAEVTYRQDTLLVSKNNAVFSWNDDPTPALGDTLHYNVNLFMPGLPSNFFSDSSTIIFEIGGNSRLDVTENEDMLDPEADKFAWQMKGVYTPEWYQALPGLTLRLPMGFTYVGDNLTSAANSFFPYRGGGDFNIGVGGTYNNVWDFEFSYRHFYGSLGDPETGNPWLDRNYVSFFIRRAF
jgi:hypothetical protein